MKSVKNILSLIFLLMILQVDAQLVINELDCDTPGLDTKEFLEIRSESPKFPLDGYVVVFFNCSPAANNASYMALDLDGYTTDINGLFLIGSTEMEPFPQYIIPVNVIQNGQDAVAIYNADIEDFPNGTLPYVDETLIDVLVYSTNEPEATSALDIFRAFNPDIQQINEGPNNNTNSIQRRDDGSYFVGPPTPGRLNEGGGIELTRIRTTFDKSVYNEGEDMVINFSSDNELEEDVTLSFSLNNGSFDQHDFTGDTVVVFAKETRQAGIIISLIEDHKEEGDEELLMVIALDNDHYMLVNNYIRIRVNDNDFLVADFGTPLSPTYGRVAGTAPKGYYNSLTGKSGDELKSALQEIIADPEIVEAHSYNDVIDIIKKADQNPENSGHVWLVYLESTMSKLDLQTTPSNIGVWNREHVWPRARGGFFSIEADTLADGIGAFWPTNADSLRHANSDAHGIRAADGQENSNRGNKFFGEYTGPTDTAGKFRGDVARAIFYLDIRYNGLEVVHGYPNSETGKFGDLAVMLDWHRADPPDDYEMNRNNVVYEWQKNRNPFIDMPELVEYIWGEKHGEAWSGPSHVTDINIGNYKVFPNPAIGQFNISGAGPESAFELIDTAGRIVFSRKFSYETLIENPGSSGLYFLKITENGRTYTQTIVID